MAPVQNRQIQRIRTGDLPRLLGITANRSARFSAGWPGAGSRLAYAAASSVPPVLPLGGQWSPGEVLALTTLMQDKDGRFQICGPMRFIGTGGMNKSRTESTPTTTASVGIAGSGKSN